jgi:endonuclease/exonuclease/phosphatase family metal-dependent hydrolase
LYSNVDSLLNKRDELNARLAAESPDIIALTEVYPKNFDLSTLATSELVIENYDMYLGVTSEVSKRGVILYVKDALNSQPMEELSSDPYRESVWCELKLKGGDRLIVGCVYRSPERSTDLNNQALLDLLCRANGYKPTHLVIMGDFNLKFIDWETWTAEEPETHFAHYFLETLRDKYFSQHVLLPTRYRVDQEPSLLDLIISNDDNYISEVRYCAPLGKSDHVVLRFSIQCYADRALTSDRRPIYHKGDYEKMREHLSVIDWDSNLEVCTNVNTMWDTFMDVIDAQIKTHIPTTNPHNSGRKSKPLWLSRNALRLVKRKHKSWHRYSNTRDFADYQLYTKARNAATAECKLSKRLFEQKLASEVKENPKAFWKYVNSKTRVKSGIADLIMDENSGSKTTNDHEKAEILNSFFTSVFTKECTENVPALETRQYSCPLDDIEFSESEVITKLSKLNISKSAGPDNLHPRILKECCEVIGKPLYTIMKRSLRSGTVPRAWKDGHISAIYKKGRKADAGNYRPISLTSVICKIFESIIRKRIIDHMEVNNLFSVHQHGFRQRRSTVTQLLEVMDDWTQALDNGKNLDTIYLDFQKAFDTVPHQRLLGKLEAYGITGNIVLWIRDFLSNRRQRVCVNRAFSDWTPVTSGIPQGSVLGPILFVIFINDMPDMVNSICKLFADDTKIYRIISGPADCDALQEDLFKLSEWSDTWLLRFNVDKCKRMHLGYTNSKYEYKLSYTNANPVAETEEEKDLGVVVDPQLKFKKHISTITNKANKIVGVIKRSFDHLDSSTVNKLYSALVRPHLEYANSVWAPFTRQEINSLERVQRRATKLIPELKSLNYRDRLQHLGFYSLAYRRKRGDMIRVYNILNGREVLNDNILTLSTTDRTRGHSLKLNKSHCRKNVRLYSFAVRVVNDWNNLPNSVVIAPSTDSFKGRLDRFWEDQVYDF